MADARGSRLAAILWFTAFALNLAAAVRHYIKDREVEWTLVAASLFVAVAGFAALRRSKSDGVDITR